jgi:hypothetical protein
MSLVFFFFCCYNVCLSWQPSQFINIVGKDDGAIPACAKGGGESKLLRGNVAGSPSQLSPCTFLNSLDLLFVTTTTVCETLRYTWTTQA